MHACKHGCSYGWMNVCVFVSMGGCIYVCVYRCLHGCVYVGTTYSSRREEGVNMPFALCTHRIM